MKILVVPDSYKDCLSAQKVAEYIRKGILKVLPGADILCLPMADGGEGTVQTITSALNGIFVEKVVYDPLLRSIKATFGIVEKDNTAIIEMAAASGLELLKIDERNPLITSTYGTGQLIVEALNRGCKRIIIGIGGSATNDVGVGALMALGVKFYDSEGKIIPNTIGADLIKIKRIYVSFIDKRIANTEILIACDVNNRLTGKEGASFVYAPQKGADSEMVNTLERNLRYFSQLIKYQFGIDIDQIPGSGAAGGLGGGLVSLAGAKILPGFELISKLVELEKRIEWADLIITGEGKIDAMTRYGKTPMGIATLALKYKKSVIAIAGSLGDGYQELYDCGFSSIHSIHETSISVEDSIKRAPELIRKKVITVVRDIINKSEKSE